MSISLDIESIQLYILTVARTTDAASNQVRYFRRVADLTQADLAQQVEVSRQTVVSIEGGDYAPSVYLALRIASVLDTTVEALFGTAKDI